MSTFLLLMKLFPILVEAIKAAEGLFPDSGKGKEKLELVRAYMETAWSTAGDMKATFSEMWPKIKPIIDKIVATLNSLGIFKK
jgi:hypothetical protein